jgi:hypothetical protein
MALFDFFKSKEDKSQEEFANTILPLIYPPESNVENIDIQRVSKIVGNIINKDKIKGFVAGCKTRIFIAKEYDEAVQVRSIIARSNNTLSKLEAYEVLAYLAGESMAVTKTILLSQKNSPPGYIEEAEKCRVFFAGGLYCDVLPNGVGKFGITPTNPIPSISPSANEYYLRSLTFRGQPISYKRISTIESNTINGFVDQYVVSQNGSDICNIYINPYQKKTSGLPPKGFQLSGDHSLGTVIANLLDPTEETITRSIWHIGGEIEREAAENMHENGEVFAINIYEKGSPRTFLTSQDKWLQAKSAFDRIEAEAKAASEQTRKILRDAASSDSLSQNNSQNNIAKNKYTFNANYTISHVQTNSHNSKFAETIKTPKKPLDRIIENKSGVNWVLVLDNFHSGKTIRLVTDELSSESDRQNKAFAALCNDGGFRVEISSE